MAALAELGPVLLAALLAAGVLIGGLSGLLGIGGGVVAVPVLLEVFASAGIAADLQPRLAIGTAHALVVLASIPAAVALWRAGQVEARLLRAWLPGVMAGMAAGLALGPLLPPLVPVAVFALVAAGLGAALLAGPAVLGPAGRGAGLPSLLVGLFAAGLGIGGGTLGGPAMALSGVALRAAIGAGAVFNLVVAVPATLVFVLAGLGAEGRPAASLGFVAPLPLLLLALPAMAVAPAAARWQARVPVGVLRRLFGACLVLIAARMAARLAGW